jgi:hypothetical protein
MNDRQNERITIPGRKYILTCLVQGKKNDSPIELGSDLGFFFNRFAIFCNNRNFFMFYVHEFKVNSKV